MSYKKFFILMLCLMANFSFSTEKEKKNPTFREKIKEYFSNKDNVVKTGFFSILILYILNVIRKEIKKNPINAQSNQENDNFLAQYKNDDAYEGAKKLLNFSDDFDCFQLLELNRKTIMAKARSEAKNDVNRAFRSISRNTHPDKHDNSPESVLAMTMLNKAKTICLEMIG